MNDVAKKKKSEISTNVIDFSNHAGVGFENVGCTGNGNSIFKNC